MARTNHDPAPGRTDELVDLAGAGDAASYEQLFARVSDRVLFYVQMRMGKQLRDRIDPIDVVQETYLEAHRSFSRFTSQGQGSFLRWLYRIAENRLRDLANHYTAKKRGAGETPVRAPEVIERLRASQTGPATATRRAEQQERLLAAMEQLEPELREALALRYFREATLEGAAEALGKSVSATRRLLARAELKLGRAMRDA